MSMSSDTQRTPGTLRDELWIKKVPSYYTAVQVAQYLSVIQFQTTFTETAIAAGEYPANLDNLGVLMRLHLLSFPFENTAMHYTPERKMDVSPEGAFKRLVIERKGSYCFGQNTVFLGMLRGLGYRAYSGAARINTTARTDIEPPSYTSLQHMLIFVQPFEDSNQTYIVDVGLGLPGLVRPVLLSNGAMVMGPTPLEKHKLTRISRSDSSLSASTDMSAPGEFKWALHVLQRKDDTDPSWKILYSFSEEEFFTQDYEDASFSVSMKSFPGNLFSDNVICNKYFVLEDETDLGQPLLYRMSLVGNELKKMVAGKSEIIQTFSEERERIMALRNIFGVDIADDSESHNRGTKAALPTSG